MFLFFLLVLVCVFFFFFVVVVRVFLLCSLRILCMQMLESCTSSHMVRGVLWCYIHVHIWYDMMLYTCYFPQHVLVGYVCCCSVSLWFLLFFFYCVIVPDLVLLWWHVNVVYRELKLCCNIIIFWHFVEVLAEEERREKNDKEDTHEEDTGQTKSKNTM